MIKRICTALIAVMIGAGAFTVPAASKLPYANGLEDDRQQP